ncbi:hypothetical protein FJ938_20825 [Mesorhizobium sp. B2-4-14]|uniref:hypothetical protein n=1 Tax=Mesorhizobium sp. B2-4-14 TaxID=2589935 RepID=UPI001128C013|nr:hypothetical protein [Mesorhizobium sp. B2-4-14]TPL01366.1 hypothetical protein FJ938_20825 [Mesorhizobium sp. B2-4-14]
MNEPFSMPDASGDPLAILATASLIGFFSIRDSNGNPTDPVSLGSGTLVRLPGDIFGVLTAAHVLDEIPTSGLLGFLTFTRQDSVQQAKIDAQLTEKFYPPGWGPGEVMPDFGFLQIHDRDALSTIRARGCAFYDLEKRREIRGMTSNKLAWEYYATGVVGESRIEIPAGADGSPKRTSFTAMAGHCSEVAKSTIGGFTIVNVQVETDRHPTTYGGVSGGGLWVITAPDGEFDKVQRFLTGVIFYQSDATDDGNRSIRAHGLDDIQAILISQFRA